MSKGAPGHPDTTERTPREPREGVWTVALRPEFGATTGFYRGLAMTVFGALFVAPLVGLVILAALPDGSRPVAERLLPWWVRWVGWSP